MKCDSSQNAILKTPVAEMQEAQGEFSCAPHLYSPAEQFI